MKKLAKWANYPQLKIPPGNDWFAGVRADSSTGDWSCLGVRGVTPLVDIHTQWYSY